MIENMNNMEDIMTNIYDSFNVLTNRPIIMVDNATLFTYGSILITTTILAVATIYDEDVDDHDDDDDNGYEEKEESASVLLNSMNLSSINEMSPFSTNQPEEVEPEREEEEKEREQEMNQNIGGKKRRKQKRTIKKHNKRKN